MKTYYITSDKIKQNCIDEIQAREHGYVVTIKEESEARSKAQLRLKWLWMAFIAKEKAGEGEGKSVEGWNRYFKGKFMRSLLIRQDEEYAEFYKKADELLSTSRNRRFAKEILIDSIKTEWLTVKSMAVLMNAIMIHASMDLALTLPIPDDLKWLNEK